MKLLSLLFISTLLSAAPPTISNVAVTTDTNTAIVSYTVTPNTGEYCWVQYGVASNTYLWSSLSFLVSAAIPGSTANCTVPINGLKDGTTYYFLPTARPDPDDETNICNTSACGAVQVSATEPPSSVSHLPAPPVSVQANLLSEPNTTGYSVITISPPSGNPTGECQSTGNVTAPAGYSWSVTAGETLTNIFSVIGYGTIIQVPEGVTCYVPATDGFGHGYSMPQLAGDPQAGGVITAANHRWIIIRTAPGGAADFPPFGARTGPSFFTHLGWFKGVHPLAGGLNSGYDVGGIIFEWLGGHTYPAHHYWVENLGVETDDTQLSAIYEPFMAFAHGESGDTPPFAEYISIRDVYFHGPNRASLSNGVPAILGAIQGTSAGQIAIAGNYIDNIYTFVWAGYPALPQILYWMDCGNPGSCTPGGPDLIDNNFIEGMGQTFYVEVNNHAVANPHDFTVTHNYFYWPAAAFTYASSFSIGGCRQQIETKGSLRFLYQGNYINGQFGCQNGGNALLFFNAEDATVLSNYITNSSTGFGLNGSNAGVGPTSYGSTSNRILLNNNLLWNLGGQWQAGGGGLQRALIEMDSTSTNVTITNNTGGPLNPASPTWGPAWFNPFILFTGGSGPVEGFTLQNNILPFGFGYGTSNGGVGVTNLISDTGTVSHPATPATYVPPTSNFTQALQSVLGYTDGASGLGMTMTSTIAGGSGYTSGTSLSFTNCATSPAGTIGISGTTVQSTGFSAFGVCNPASWTATAAGGTGATLRPHYGLTSAYHWGGNLDVCTYFNGGTISASQCTSSAAAMPSGDNLVSSGAAIADRFLAAGVTSNYSISPTSVNPGNVGANLNAIMSATGTVTNVSIQLGVTAAQVSYTAPDARACSVDVSTDDTNWTRVTDSGGGPNRSLSFTALTAGTLYYYRTLCYFSQLSPLFAGSQVTDGTFITLTAGTRSPSFPFSLSTFTGSTGFKVTMTAPDGVTQYTNTCATSPCTVSSVPVGDYSTMQQWLKGSSVIAFSDAQVIQVR